MQREIQRKWITIQGQPSQISCLRKFRWTVIVQSCQNWFLVRWVNDVLDAFWFIDVKTAALNCVLCWFLFTSEIQSHLHLPVSKVLLITHSSYFAGVQWEGKSKFYVFLTFVLWHKDLRNMNGRGLLEGYANCLRRSLQKGSHISLLRSHMLIFHFYELKRKPGMLQKKKKEQAQGQTQSCIYSAQWPIPDAHTHGAAARLLHTAVTHLFRLCPEGREVGWHVMEHLPQEQGHCPRYLMCAVWPNLLDSSQEGSDPIMKMTSPGRCREWLKSLSQGILTQ